MGALEQPPAAVSPLALPPHPSAASSFSGRARRSMGSPCVQPVRSARPPAIPGSDARLAVGWRQALGGRGSLGPDRRIVTEIAMGAFPEVPQGMAGNLSPRPRLTIALWPPGEADMRQRDRGHVHHGAKPLRVPDGAGDAGRLPGAPRPWRRRPRRAVRGQESQVCAPLAQPPTSWRWGDREWRGVQSWFGGKRLEPGAGIGPAMCPSIAQAGRASVSPYVTDPCCSLGAPGVACWH